MRGFCSLLTRLLSGTADPNKQDGQLNTPLHLALSNNQLEAVNILLEYSGTRVDIQDSFGRLPLHWLVLYFLLIFVSCSLTLSLFFHPIRACKIGFIAGMKRLCECDINLATKGGDTPLHWVVQESKLDCLKLLLLASPKLDITNTRQQTPLDISESQHVDGAIRKALLEAHAAEQSASAISREAGSESAHLSTAAAPKKGPAKKTKLQIVLRK